MIRPDPGPPNPEFAQPSDAERLARVAAALASRGFTAEMVASGAEAHQRRIGVRRDDAGRLQAHAWLVKDGELYLESNPEMTLTHSVLARFPEAPGS
jgi:hypothetical protein